MCAIHSFTTPKLARSRSSDDCFLPSKYTKCARRVPAKIGNEPAQVAAAGLMRGRGGGGGGAPAHRPTRTARQGWVRGPPCPGCRRAAAAAALRQPGSRLLLRLGPQRQRQRQRGRFRAGSVGQAMRAALSGSATATLKVAGISYAVVKLVKSGRLSEQTAEVLSKVSFQLCIPSLMLVQVATTVSRSPDVRMAALPLLALVQIGVGAFAGSLGSRLVFRVQEATEEEDGRARFAIASSASMAMGVPLATTALMKRPEQKPPPLLRQMTVLAAAFPNSMTVPLVLLSTLLGLAESARAVGFLALFLLGWSPTLWSAGFSYLHGGDRGGAGAAGTGKSEPPEGVAAEKAAARVPPLWDGVSATVRRVLNPPLYGAILGVAIGLVPHLADGILPGRAGPPLLATKPWEIQVLVGAVRSAMEVVEMLGKATLPMQAIVLAASMALSKQLSGPAGEAVRLLPADRYERGIFLVSSVVRLVISPLVGLASVLACRHFGWLPADRICHFVVATISAMPSAQNMVLLLNLRDNTREAAPMMSSIILRQYVLSAVVSTVWVGVFACVFL